MPVNSPKPFSIKRRSALGVIGLSPLITLSGLTVLAPWGMARAASKEWQQIVTQARGQTVYFNAWGGAPTINAYIQWASKQVQAVRGHGQARQNC